MKKSGLIIYLNATWPSLQKRLESSKDRPLVDPGKNWQDVKRRWESRQSFYQDADYIMNTDNLNPLQVAENISQMLEMDKRA